MCNELRQCFRDMANYRGEDLYSYATAKRLGISTEEFLEKFKNGDTEAVKERGRTKTFSFGLFYGGISQPFTPEKAEHKMDTECIGPFHPVPLLIALIMVTGIVMLLFLNT